jgi:hypothetical protein
VSIRPIDMPSVTVDILQDSQVVLAAMEGIQFLVHEIHSISDGLKGAVATVDADTVVYTVAILEGLFTQATDISMPSFEVFLATRTNWNSRSGPYGVGLYRNVVQDAEVVDFKDVASPVPEKVVTSAPLASKNITKAAIAAPVVEA